MEKYDKKGRRKERKRRKRAIPKQASMFPLQIAEARRYEYKKKKEKKEKIKEKPPLTA